MRRSAALLFAALPFASCTPGEPGPRASADPPPAPASASVAPSSSAPAPAVASERAFHPQESDLFTKKLPPRSGDWLARFHESGQSFVSYRGSEPVRPTSERNKLVMQPLGSFGPADNALLEKLRGFMSDFFILPARLRKPI